MPAPGNKPKNLLHTVRELMAYLGQHKLLLLPWRCSLPSRPLPICWVHT